MPTSAGNYFSTMKPSDWIGVYAATLSTVLALARAVAWFRARRNRVTVRMENGEMVSYGSDGGVALRTPSVRLSVLNRGEHPVRVEHIGFLVHDIRVGVRPPTSISLPAEVAAHDALNVDLPVSTEKHRGPLRGYVQLVTGEVFTSQRLRRRKRPAGMSSLAIPPAPSRN